MSRIRAIHQALGKSSPGYSISDYALALQDALRAWGYESYIYAAEVDPALAGRVRPWREFRPRRDGSEMLLLHYVMASPITQWVKQLKLPLILCYHNVTPPEFFAGLGGALAHSTQQARVELAEFRDCTRLALADSAFNERELRQAGYSPVLIQPILIPETLQQVQPDADVMALAGQATTLLFVGRLAPNKRCEDAVRILYYYRQIDPRARLFLVGATQFTQRYVNWLKALIEQLGLNEAVIMTGHVSREALAAYYRIADVFILMSEHEGFGIPLIESMRLGLPVVAYASSAVPETLGEAGILIHRKLFPVMAELIHLLQTDAVLRARVVEHQRARAREFAPDVVLEKFRRHIELAVGEL